MSTVGHPGTDDLRVHSSALSVNSPVTSPAGEPTLQVAHTRQPALVWLEVRGFRAFGTVARRLDLDAPLVVIQANNSHGKTSLAEAVEFLITGASSRRDLFGAALAEFHDSLRNAHLPAGDEDVYVAAGVRGANGTVYEVRRQMIGDFAHGSPCQSTLTVDGQVVADLSTVGLPISDPKVNAPVLLQHTLRYVLATQPKDRVTFFKALLDLTDLDQLRTSIAAVKAQLGAIPLGPALRAVAALGSTGPDVATGLAALRVSELDDDAARQTVQALLLRCAEVHTGLTSTDLPALATDLAALATSQQEKVFALTPFRARAAAPAPPPEVDTSAYVQALEQADREAAALVPVLGALLRVPAYAVLQEATDCPVCATPQALTPERMQVLREQLRRTEQVDRAVASVERALISSRSELERLPAAITAAVPTAARWGTEQVQSAVATLESLDLQRAPLDEALRTAAAVAAAAEQCGPLLVAFASSVREAETAVSRRQDLPAPDPARHEDLTAALQLLAQARELHEEAVRELSAIVTPAAQVRAITPGLTQLRAVVEQAGSLVTELRNQAGHRSAVERLERADRVLVQAIMVVLDARFEQMSEAISTWWTTVRPQEELVSFAGVQRRASGQKYINLRANLRAGAYAEPVQRDAVGVYSDSQLNALGLATFLARAQLLAAPFLFLDDPIPGSDSDHRVTFADNTLSALIEGGHQVILTTFDTELAGSAANLHRHRSPITYQLTLQDPVEGTEPVLTSDVFTNHMSTARDSLAITSSRGRRISCGHLRDAVERLAKQIIATNKTAAGEPCTVAEAFPQMGAKNLSDALPHVRGFALAPDEPGRWNEFISNLNPGNHDDKLPSTATLNQLLRNLSKISRAHNAKWDSGLLR